MPHAWVVGASRGLGRASVDALAARGYDVTLSARAGARLETAVDELKSQYPERTIAGVPLDLGDEASVATAIEEVLSSGTPDAVVLSSGGPAPSTAASLDLEALDAAYRTLLRPTSQLITGLSPSMVERGSGAIAVVTSSGVREPIRNLATSNIMRAGMTALMKGAADELAPHGVRVLAVAPGRIGTERVSELDEAAASRAGTEAQAIREGSIGTIPAGRYGTPTEFGDVVAYMVSSAASYVTGTTISIDGGKSRGLLA